MPQFPARRDLKPDKRGSRTEGKAALTCTPDHNQTSRHNSRPTFPDRLSGCQIIGSAAECLPGVAATRVVQPLPTEDLCCYAGWAAVRMDNAGGLFAGDTRPRVVGIPRCIVHHVQGFLVSVQRDWPRRRDIRLVARHGLWGA